jgi:predicted transcriptional regulator
MPRSPTPHPTDGELEILEILWERGSSPLGEICAALRERREVATTTVATMLKVMLGKKLVRRARATKGYRWSAAVSRDTAAEGLVGKLVDRVFAGSAGRLVAHMMEAGRLSDDDLDEVRRLLADAKIKRSGSGKPRPKQGRKRS